MIGVLALALSVHCAAGFRQVVECKQHTQMGLRMALLLLRVRKLQCSLTKPLSGVLILVKWTSVVFHDHFHRADRN
jgi:hypothetical protein